MPAMRLSIPLLLLFIAACDRGGTPTIDAHDGNAEIVGNASPGPAANGAGAEEARPPQEPLAAAPALALSDEQIRAQYTPALDACLNMGDAAKGVSVAMGGCFNAELKVQDDRLNAAYRSALAKRDPAGQAQLRAEERAWIKRRDAECRAIAVGGTIDMVEVPSCLLNETVRRRIALQPMAG